MPEPSEAKLQPNQISCAKLFFHDEGPINIGFGGPRGGAKSHTVRAIALEAARRNPGSRTFIVRTNWTDLYENHYLEFSKQVPGINELWHGDHKEYVLPNKSSLAYKFADTYQEIEKLARGPQCMFLLIDQAEQFEEKWLKMLRTCNRWPGVPAGHCKTGHFFNPGGPGNEYLKRVYYAKKYTDDENPEHYSFVFSKGWENYEWFRGTGLYDSARAFYADSDENRFRNFIYHTDYGRNLWDKPESLRLGELYGSFEHFAGQYYGGVWDESTHILRAGHADAIIEPWWRRWIAIDWGFAHNAAVGWFAAGKLQPAQAARLLGINATKPIEVVICYRDMVVKETAEGEFAAQIAERTPLDERKQISRCFLSPETFGERGSAHAIGKVLRQLGLPMPEPAANQRVTRGVGTEGERIGGWRLLHNMLRQTARFSQDAIEEQSYAGGPALMVSEACTAVKESIPALMRDEDNPEDVRKIDSVADDVGDMIRYGMTEYLSANAVPISVQAKEVYNSIQGSDDLAMTQRAMAMRQFENSKIRTRIGARSWRG